MVGALAYTFFTIRTDLWVQKGRVKVGLLGSILLKSHIPKSTFDSIFDIREDYSLSIQNMRTIYLLGFSIQRLWQKSLEISRNYSICPLFSKYDWKGGSYLGLHPYIILGQNTFFCRRDIDF